MTVKTADQKPVQMLTGIKPVIQTTTGEKAAVRTHVRCHERAGWQYPPGHAASRAAWLPGARIPQRIHLDVPGPKGVALFMLAYMDQSIGIKTVTLFDDNPGNGVPYIQGMYCLFDGTNGTPTAIMDGKALTAIRTGAASGLATDLLARENATTVTILGAGVQARTQLKQFVPYVPSPKRVCMTRFRRVLSVLLRR